MVCKMVYIHQYNMKKIEQTMKEHRSLKRAKLKLGK